MQLFLDSPQLKTIRDAAATIRAVLFFAAPIVAGGSFLLLMLNGVVADPVMLEITALSAVLLATGAWLGTWYYVVRVHVPAPYEIQKLYGLLVIEPVGGHHRYTHERRTTVKATRNKLRLVEHRSQWTGNGSRNRRSLECLTAEHQLFAGHHAEEDGRTQLWVYLGDPIDRGDVATVEVREVFEDDLEPMRLYHRKGGGRFKTRNLTVRTRFVATEEPDPRDVEGLVWSNDRKNRERSIVGKVDWKRRPRPEDGTVEYLVVVPRPKRYHSYGIRWKWRAGPAAASPQAPAEMKSGIMTS